MIILHLLKKKYNSPTLLILGLKDENNIYINIACKGTTNYDEWIKNFNFESKDIMMEHDMYINLKKSVKISNPKIRIHKGYYEFIQNVLELGIHKLNRLLNTLKYNNSINLVINITGHSLGGGLSTLFTEKIKQIYYNASINLITFYAPRVVNNTFKDYLKLNRIYCFDNDIFFTCGTPFKKKNTINKVFFKIFK